MKNEKTDAEWAIKLAAEAHKHSLEIEAQDKQTTELLAANEQLQKATEKIKKANHLTAFISQVNQKIVRVKNEATLFRNACDIALEFGGFKMAWVGMFDKKRKKIVLVAQSGIPDKEITLFSDAVYQSTGPHADVMHSGKYYVCNDTEHDLPIKNWKEFAARHGIQSYMALPISKSGMLIGTLNLYSTKLDFAGEEEIKLLVELSDDISFALDLFEKEKQHNQEVEEIKVSEMLYHSLFDHMHEGFAHCQMIYENGIAQNFVYLNVNEAFEILTGLKDVVGKRVTEVIPGIKTSQPELLETYGRVADTGKPEKFEIYLEVLQMWLNISVYSTERGYFTAVFDNVTLRKQADQELVNSEKHFRALIEHGADMKSLTTKDGKVLYGSPSIKKGLGYTAEEFLLKYPFHIIHPDDISDYLENRERLLHTPGQSFNFEQRRLHKNGAWIWCDGTITNMLNEPGVTALVSNFRDISDKKARQQQQEFDDTNLKALINNTKDLMWSVDRDFNLITANAPFDEIIKTLFGKAIEKGSCVLLPEYTTEMVSYYKQLYERAFAGESFTTIDHFSIPFEVWAEISYYPIRNGDEVIGTACHTRDITASKMAQKTILQSEARLKEAQAISHISNWEIDLLTGVNTWSDEFYNIMGIGRNDMQPGAEGFMSFIHPDENERIREIIKISHETHKDSSFYSRVITKDGHIKDIYSQFKFDFDDVGKPIRLYGILQDITERKRNENQVTELNETIKAAYYQQSGILNALPSSIALLDTKGVILSVNEAWEKFGKDNNFIGSKYGVSDNYLEVSAKATGIDEKDGQEAARGITSVLQGEESKFEMEYACHSPTEERWFNMQVRALSEGKNAGVVVMHVNVTQQRQAHDAIANMKNELEERVTVRTNELLDANKSLEAFSYSVSHDLRSPVRSVMGFAKIFNRTYGAGLNDDARELLQHIEEAGKRMNTIIDDLLSFAKWGKGQLNVTEVDMTALFAHVWKNTLLESPHTAVLELQPLPIVQADKPMIRQVVVNLISNAVKYSSKMEHAVVKVGFEETEEEVIFHITDNGAGFDMQNYGRLFGTFQRLHSVSDFEGTGIGLALVKTIVEKHKGRIWAEAKVDGGATFWFSLPKALPSQ